MTKSAFTEEILNGKLYLLCSVKYETAGTGLCLGGNPVWPWKEHWIINLVTLSKLSGLIFVNTWTPVQQFDIIPKWRCI